MNLTMPLRNLNRNRWNLAFFENASLKNVISGDYSGIRWMKYSDRSRWFADPFILSADEDRIIVLVEELSYNINRGRIAKLIVDRRTMQLSEMKIILDLTTHLSFPMIVRRGDDVIVIPENSASNKSTAYLLTKDAEELEPIGIVVDEALTDAIYCKIDDKDYILSTSLPNANGNELRVFEFDLKSLKAKYLYSKYFDSAIARNAGCLICHENITYRPAQDCNGEYGRGVILQQVSTRSESGELSFSNSHSLYPFSRRYQLGLHTLNSHDGLCVIDGRGLLHPYIGRMVRPIINMLKR